MGILFYGYCIICFRDIGGLMDKVMKAEIELLS